MKVGIIGAGAVGSACMISLIMRGCAHEIVLVDRTETRAKAVALDMLYGASLSAHATVRHGHYDDLADAALVMITVGVNEKAGGATDRSDPNGRLKLLNKNIEVYNQAVPPIVKAAPDAVLLVVTDPPDPLADLTRRLSVRNAVLSTGTWLDSMRLCLHIAERLGVSPLSVEAQILGEHGTSEVFVWSGVRIAGVPLATVLIERGENEQQFRALVENAVRYANIAIIEGNEASQYGIGMVCARIAEAILRDERIVVPIGAYSPEYGVTLSLPSILGRRGVHEVLPLSLSEEERAGLQRSATKLKEAVAHTDGRMPPRN